MSLPNDVSTLNYPYYGTSFCYTVAKTSIDVFSMDFTYYGTSFVGTQELVPPPDVNTGTLDVAYAGLPYADLNSDYTLDTAWGGLPFISGVDDRNKTLIPSGFGLTISAPSADIDGWHRKMPNPRTEMVFSAQEPAHVFPTIAAQTPSLLP